MADGGAEASGVAEAGGRGFARAYAQLRADHTIQFDLPTFHPPVEPEWVKALARWLHAAAPVLRWIGWGALALIVLALLLVAARRFLGLDLSLWRRRAADAEEAAMIDAAPARALLVEADALAAGGRYAEAAHLLLLRGVEEIARRRPHLLAPSLTARDIAAAPALPAKARATFAGIAALVERSLFGGRAVDAAGWAEARAAFADFALAGTWR